MAVPTQGEFKEYIADLAVAKVKENTQELVIRRGKVVDKFPNGEPKIQFAGEDEPREKIFTRMSDGVGIGDRVFLIQAFGSWLYWKDFTESYEV